MLASPVICAGASCSVEYFFMDKSEFGIKITRLMPTLAGEPNKKTRERSWR